jgi:RNA polymerase sigma-70 factor (ECF subfamily)
MQENEWSARDDWDLAESAGHGDEDALAELIARHRSAMHRFIYRSFGQEETARDLTQEVFVRAWFALPKVSRKAKFTTWLFHIAVNICRDHARLKATRQERMTFSLVKDAQDDNSEERQFVHPDDSPDQVLEHAELTQLLDEQIRRLPDELLQSFLLGAVERHPYKEVAAMLGLSSKAVETRIYRARQLLAERLGNSGLNYLK